MKKLLKKRLLGIPIGVIAAVVLTTGVALAAAFTLSIPSHVQVVSPPPPPDYTIGVYTTPVCNVPVTNIEWGDLVQGTSKVKTVYVKNLGTAPVAVTVSPIPADNGILLTSSPSPLNLAVGSVGACTLTITAEAGAPLGDYDFDTIFNSDPQP